MKKLPHYLKHIVTMYISDKSIKKSHRHLPLGEGDMKYELLFKKLTKL